MLTKQEREPIIAALEAWATSAPDEPMLGFIETGALKTPREILNDVNEGSPDGEAVMQIIEHAVRRIGLGPVVERLRPRLDLLEF